MSAPWQVSFPEVDAEALHDWLLNRPPRADELPEPDEYRDPWERRR